MKILTKQSYSCPYFVNRSATTSGIDRSRVVHISPITILQDNYSGLNFWEFTVPGLEITIFSREPNCIFISFPKGVVYSKQYIFGLPAEIWGSRRSIQGSPGLPAPPNFEPRVLRVLLRGASEVEQSLSLDPSQIWAFLAWFAVLGRHGKVKAHIELHLVS